MKRLLTLLTLSLWLVVGALYCSTTTEPTAPDVGVGSGTGTGSGVTDLGVDAKL